ncbi:MAG: hypothetical protein ACE5FF_04945 [Saprospiraceae bacterium]
MLTHLVGSTDKIVISEKWCGGKMDENPRIAHIDEGVTKVTSCQNRSQAPGLETIAPLEFFSSATFLAEQRKQTQAVPSPIPHILQKRIYSY